MPSVSVRELSLNFGDVQVLRNLNLDIEEGEFLVLLGPSGCGKSTLLNCIAGLLDASRLEHGRPPWNVPGQASESNVPK